MNRIDKRIIEILRQNSRTPFTQIARRINLPEASVRYRVKSLVKKGVIKRFTLELAAGGISSLIGVKTDPNTETRKICNALLKIQGIERVFELTGDFDLMTLVRTSDSNTLNTIIDSIRATPGVVSTSSFFVLQEHGA
jgi:DNA-binding Lrp family transcriptional regulator